MLKGGDATKGTLTTMYDGPRPFEPMPNATTAAVGGNNPPAHSLTLAKCVPGADNQTWGFHGEQTSAGFGTAIAVGRAAAWCVDITEYQHSAGSAVHVYACGVPQVKGNQFWDVAGDTIRSMQPNTPFCLSVAPGGGADAGKLASCTSPDAQFAIGFSNTTNGTVVHKASGYCLTTSDQTPPPHHHGGRGYQPMKKQGAIILATGGDNSNGAMGKVRSHAATQRGLPRASALTLASCSLFRPEGPRTLTRSPMCTLCWHPAAHAVLRGHHGNRGHDGRG